MHIYAALLTVQDTLNSLSLTSVPGKSWQLLDFSLSLLCLIYAGLAMRYTYFENSEGKYSRKGGL